MQLYKGVFITELPYIWKEHLRSLPETGMGFQTCNFCLKDFSIVEAIVLNGEYIVNCIFNIDDIANIILKG